MSNSRYARHFMAVLVMAAPFGPAPDARAQVADSPPARIAETFVRHMQGGRFDSAAAMISPAVPAGALGEPQLRQIWRQLTGANGQLQDLSLARVVPHDTLQLVELAARFERASLTIRVVLMPDRTVGGLWFLPAASPEPPAYADTTRFTEETVRFGEEPWIIEGTLTLPAGDSSAPAVVLVHGSGPQDRDETVGPNKPFRDLAWGLASRGIAVLRYDKRTWTYAARLPKDLTVEGEVIEDAVAAARFLRQHPRIDSTAVFMAGHSLGGMLAPRIALRDSSIAGIILLAAPARPLQQVVHDQIRHIQSLPGTDAETRKRLDSVLDSLGLLRDRRLPPETIVMGAAASYYYDLEEYDAVRAAQQLERPILVLQGLRDYQVTENDLNTWIRTLRGNRNATVHEYPALNHLFMEGRGTSTPAEYANPGHVAQVVIEDIVSWIRERSAP